MGISPGFWENVLRPMKADTIVTAAMSLLKLVTPLSILASSWAKPPLNVPLFILGVVPVALVVALIIYLALSGKVELLASERFRRDMRELEGRFGSNAPEGPPEIKLMGGRASNNPAMREIAPTATALTAEGEQQ